MNAEIDTYPVGDLPTRYNIGKQAMYNRLESLGIKPEKIGNRSFITAPELSQMEALHAHILAGGTMADFPGSQPTAGELSTRPVDTGAMSSGHDTDFLTLIETIAKVLRPTDPLSHLANLERASEKGWLLTSAEIKQLIGVKPTVKKGETEFVRGSFAFVKAGKIGGQSAWKVLKRERSRDRD